MSHSKVALSTVFCWLLFSSQSFALQFRADSLLLADSLNAATTPAGQPAGPSATFEGPVRYWAETISLSDSGNVIRLSGQAKLVYLDMTLTAARIEINQRTRTLYARGIQDTLNADSAALARGTPVFTETGREPLMGREIEYNFETRRGKVKYGKTKMEPGFYRGAHINRIADSTLLVQDGIFTSCEYIDNPHYYFQSDQIRLKVKDKVVVKPIVFYIADVPLAWLPFGIFPNKRGRHSGIVIPTYGENRVGGRYLRGMGYYWAPNDYFDATFLTDFYDKTGFSYRVDTRYTVRYKLNGSLSAEYYPRDPYSGSRVERWRFRFQHRHVIDPTLSISGSGSFQSDKSFARQLSPNMDDRLNQNITSSLNLSKRWKGTKNSMSIGLSKNENLQSGRESYTFPSITFNRSQSSIYETLTGKKLGGKRSWYQNINFSYNTNLIRKGSRVPFTKISGDSTITGFTDSESQGMKHRLSFSAPQKVLRYLNINPSLSYNEVWVNEVLDPELNEETNTIELKKKKQFAAQRTFNTSISAKTTLFGLFEPNIGSFKLLRHKLDPSVSFSFTPDFSSPFYGNYVSVRDTAGTQKKYDRFQNSPFGGTPGSRSQRMSLSLSNVFQGKFVDDEGNEKKVDLLTATFSSGYNFLRDSLRWSNISSNFRTKIMRRNINVRATFSPYRYNKNGRQINKFNTFPTLVNLSTAFSFNLSNKTFSKKKRKPAAAGREEEVTAQEESGILSTRGIEYEEHDFREEAKKIDIPWSTSLNINYSYNKLRTFSRVDNNPHRFGVSARANLQLTKNWKISWNARFDVAAREITSQSFNIYRDLHCWEMSFGWQPQIGYYDFQINIKASALQDIKLTKHPAGSTRFRRY